MYDDWDNVNELTSHPDHTPHRKVDKIVLDAGSDSGNNRINTAIVAPAVIYGVGGGPHKKLSYPRFRAFLNHKKVFAVGKGDNIGIMSMFRIYRLFISVLLRPLSMVTRVLVSGMKRVTIWLRMGRMLLVRCCN